MTHHISPSEAMTDVRAYYGTDAYNCFLQLLSALEAEYKEDLVAVSKERLERKQGAVAQVRLLHQLMISKEEIQDSPKV